MKAATTKLTPPYRVGDIVRLTGKFLRQVGWYTNVPINGEVQEVKDSVIDDRIHQVLTVHWSDDNRGNVLACNVEFCPKGRELTLRRRREQP